MNILGVIPARYGSSRLPGKPLLDINGLPMIVRVYQQAKQVGRLSRLIVATDDARIAAVLKTYGVPHQMTAAEHPNGTARCWEAYEQLKRRGEDYDFVVNIQGDEPFLQPAQLETLIHLLVNHGELTIGTLIKRITDADLLMRPEVVKVVCDAAGRALYFSRSMIPYMRSAAEASASAALRMAHYYKHIGCYGYRGETLRALVALPQTALETAEALEQLRWMAHGYRIHTAETEYESISIDTTEDLAWAKKQGLLKETNA